MKTFRRFYQNLKMRQKLTLFSTVSVLLLCLVFLSFYDRVASETVLSRARQTTVTNLQQIEAYLKTMDVAVSSRLSHLGTSISVQKTLELAESGGWENGWSVDALLRDIQSASQIEHVALYTLAGDYVAGTAPDTDPDWKIGGKVISAVCAMPGTNYWHDDVPHTKSRTDGVTVYRAICAVPGEAIGVARVQLSVSALADMYNYVGFNVVSDIYLFSGRGNLLLPRETTSPAVLRVGRDSFEDYAAGVRESEATYTFRNKQYLVRSLPLEAYDLYVVSVADYAELLQDTHTLQTTILLLGLVCILVQLAYFFFMGNSLSRPIVALSEKMEQVRDGDLSLRTGGMGEDEIGTLSRSFDSMLDRIEELMAEVAAVEKRRHELELISLQTQITPHFLYNSLDGVSALAQMGDMEGAYEMSKALGAFYRQVLSDGRSVIRVEEELTLTDSYLRVQSHRYRDGFDYSIEVDPPLLSAGIVKLTIQPLVENAIYHGIRSVRRRGRILISGRVEGTDMILSVQDNGKGIPREREPVAEKHQRGDLILHRRGYGMYNADQRIKLYFGAAYGLSVESVPEAGTRVDIRLPLQTYADLQDGPRSFGGKSQFEGVSS